MSALLPARAHDVADLAACGDAERWQPPGGERYRAGGELTSLAARIRALLGRPAAAQ